MKYNVPILIICFKRYEKTLELFNRIKSINPKKVYVAIDGARNEEEKLKVDKVASIFENIDCDFEIKVRRSKTNQGCKYGVYNAINWFFEHEEYGIILEDDILPYPQFFPYCEELLEKYKDDKRIATISGWGYFYYKKPENYDATYYFSHVQSSWGWATWKDRWEMIDLEMKNTKFEEIEKNFINDGLPDEIIEYYRWIYDNKICFDTTWDYQFCLSVLMKNNMYCIQPLKTFVRNVGDTDATHTSGVDLNKSEVIEENFVMKHPDGFFYNPSFDVIRNHNTHEYRITKKKKVKNPIKILFDNQIFDLQKFGGISRAYVNIKNELNQTSEFDVDISIKTTNNEYLKDLYPSGNTNNFLVTQERLKKGDFDIFYPTFFYPNFLNDIGNKPYVMSVHDMIPEIYDEYFSRDDLQIVGKREMVKHAAAIEVQTECTKNDLVRILGVDESKIHVVGRALDPSFGTRYYANNVLDFDYILYVGGRDYYKRFDWFIKHIKPFLEKHQEIRVVCTGKEFNEQEIKFITEQGLWGRVNTIFANDLVMASLYKHAKFFVFSSEYEGFGLPVLESYKMGCIALLNDIKVFREITDGQGTFFNLKENESNLSEVAERVFSLTDEERETILNTQYKILEKYSFDKYINNIKEMFKSVLNKKKVTIITINYNNAEGLKKTIHSVTSQTYFDKIEYVVIDGGSTDGSKEIIEENKDKISYWCSEKDNGVYNAMNKGVEHCSGEYVLFLNSGDYFNSNDVIEKVYDELDVDIVYGALNVHRQDGSTYIINDDYFLNKGIPHPSCFTKTSLLRKNKYREDYKIISDWIFFYEQIYLKHTQYKCLKTVISDFFMGGLSSNFRECEAEKQRYLMSLNNVKIAMCSIGRMENKYAVEFVEFYHNLGVDKFFIYDNNYDDEEHFEEVLQKYIDDGIVEIIDYRNKSYCQVQSYQDCYDKHGKEYDWICFFDFDEFLWLENDISLKELLSSDIYKGFDMLHVNELIYGDSGNIRYEDKPVIERFKTPVLPIDYRKTYNFPENCHVKTIVRGGIDGLKWNGTPHTPTNNDLKCCGSIGQPCQPNSPFVIPYTHRNIILRHYKTKSLEEFYNTKVKRGYPDGNKDFFKKNSWVKDYFSENQVTQEKVDFINTEILHLYGEITIIMPCYNYAHYIKETIDSLKNSTYEKWNCIIVNDGSTDNSEEVIFKLIDGDNRFTYIKQPNKGVSAARNIGIRAANTKYILCLDPDDKISPTYIENAIKYLNEHEDVTLYYGKAKMFYDNGNEEDWNLPKYSYEQLIYSNCIYSAFVYRRKDYERIGGYDEGMRGYEDWEFLVRLLSDNKKIYMTDDVVFYYRRHDDSKDSIASKDTKMYKRYIINKNNEIISRTLEMIEKNK